MLRPTFLVLSCCLLTVLAGTPKEHLLRDLLDKYDANVDPGNIKLKFGVSLICARLNKETGTVIANVWESHAWKDKRLAWIPAEYGGVDKLRIPAELVWTPDITQYFSATSRTERDDVNVVLTSDGSLIWIPRVTYEVVCTGETELTCPWRIGSWTYDGENVALEAQSADPLDLQYYGNQCPLVVVSHKAEVVTHKYPCCAEPYPSLDATIVFKPRQ
jgi:hypothetical protein